MAPEAPDVGDEGTGKALGRGRGPGTPVAFLGLGRMGSPMAANVGRAGFPLVVWNRTATRTEEFVRSFDPFPPPPFAVRGAATPAAAVRGARVIVTMVSDGPALMTMLEGPEGVLGAIEPGALLIEMSTLGRRATLAAAGLVTSAGGRYIDAPVSGSVGPAARGDLTALVGGRLSDVERGTPVLRAMCSHLIHAGGVGQGQALKVIVNGIGAHHVVAFASMLALGERVGLTREVLVDAFTKGAFASPSYVGKRRKILARDFSAEFSLELTLKDTLLNVELQDEARLPLPVHRAIVEAVREAVAEGLGDEDLFALEKHYGTAGVADEPDAAGEAGAGSGRTS